MNPKKHYHLWTVSLYYSLKDDESKAVHTRLLNLVTSTASENPVPKPINATLLMGTCTQASQMLEQSFGEIKIEVLDAVVNNISYLGYQSEEEYASNINVSEAPERTPVH